MAEKKNVNLTDALTGKKSLGSQLMDMVKDHPIESALMYGFIKGSKDKLEKKKQEEKEKKNKK